MAKGLINDTTLTSIANAIREKTGSTEQMLPSEMISAIQAINDNNRGFTEEDLTFTQVVPAYTLSSSLGTKIVNSWGNLINFINVLQAEYLFNNNTANLSDITINVTNFNPERFMYGCTSSKLPRVVGTLGPEAKNALNMCSSMTGIREFPKSFYEGIDYSSYDLGFYNAFQGCTNLRVAPIDWIKTAGLTVDKYTGAGYYGVFFNCYCLDEIIGYPVNQTIIPNTNMMYGFIANAERLANFTFETERDGTPIVVQWSGQTLDLSKFSTGYGSDVSINSISGITADKEVTDDVTYQSLKNDPNWFTKKMEYSRYNHDSAVNTINSLPNASAYLAEKGGINTIKFKGEAGSATDGGAINTLTDAEIAVATDKGWTVTLI